MINFDWLTYINYYPDLINNDINTEDKAINHWKNHGSHENRMFPVFDWKIYLKLNPDLIKSGINTQNKAKNHWFTCGYKEGRLKTIISDNYNSNLNLYEKTLLNNLFDTFIINNNNKIINIERNIYPIYSNNDTKKNFTISFNDNKINNNIIPKKIHKIFLNDTKQYIDKNIYTNAIATWETYYPDYIINIYDKNDAINYLNKYYGKEFIYIYNLLIPLAYKADFLRLCILYQEGGIYSDIKQCINQRLDINFEKYNFVYTEEKHMDWSNYLKINYPSIQNCFIATVPKHPYIKCAIDLLIQNVLNRYYCLCDIDITGPIVFGCSINQVKKHWSFLDETFEKKLYFNRYKTNDLNTYVISEHNMIEINNDYNYLIKHKYDNNCSINNWNNSVKKKDNSQIYSISWKYKEVFAPIYSYNEKKSDINSIVKPYKKYINGYFLTDMMLENINYINSFILIIDTTNEENIYINHFINIYSYCKTFITIKIINNKFILLCNNNIQINNVNNISDIFIFLNKYFHKINNIILWNDIPSNNNISIDIKKIINFIDENKQNYDFNIYKSFYLYSKTEQENILLIHKCKLEKINNNMFINDIKPFMIYFPQFHSFMENDLNFYKGFTDAINLQKLLDSNKIFPQHYKTLTPLICNNITEYNLKNRTIIEKQIDIIEHYGIAGFAIYYYWFSKNTVSNQNMLMKDVIDIFFEINLKNRKIYFIWANECWTKSAALSGNINYLIENTYEQIYLQKNINNLIKYFKNDGYLKINNKPVLFIHHPWMMREEELQNMYKIFNETCILHSFNGIEIVVNSIFQKNPNFKNYAHNLNYKWNSNKNYECKYYDEIYSNLVVDYNEYIQKDLGHVKNDEINVYFTDFDNSARLIEPNKINTSTYLVNNTDLNKQLFLYDIVCSYKNKNNYIDKILLINGFNEWGEQMAFEPSKEFEYYNLNLLSNYVLNDINDVTNIIVLTGGKTGGTTLSKTLNQITNTKHFHSNHHFLEWINQSYKNSYNSIYEYIDKNNIKYLITVNRSIFERKISGFFQCLNSPNDYNKIFNIPLVYETTIDELYDFFVKNLLNSEFETYDPIEEILLTNNKNIPTNFFNFEKKYGIIELNNNVNIMVLRFKDINIWDEILSNFFNKQITLISENVTQHKNINLLYDKFKLKVKNTNLFLQYSMKETTNNLFNVCNNINDYIELEKKWTNIY